MRTKKQVIREALQGKAPEIPEPRIIITKCASQSDAEARRIAAPKVEAAKRHYYKTYKPGDEKWPIMVMTFDSPFDSLTYGDDYKKFKTNEK